jgi:hypothetical protein
VRRDARRMAGSESAAASAKEKEPGQRWRPGSVGTHVEGGGCPRPKEHAPAVLRHDVRVGQSGCRCIKSMNSNPVLMGS